MSPLEPNSQPFSIGTDTAVAAHQPAKPPSRRGLLIGLLVAVLVVGGLGGGLSALGTQGIGPLGSLLSSKLAGNWKATTSNSAFGFTFALDDGRTNITGFHLTFSRFHCEVINIGNGGDGTLNYTTTLDLTTLQPTTTINSVNIAGQTFSSSAATPMAGHSFTAASGFIQIDTFNVSDNNPLVGTIAVGVMLTGRFSDKTHASGTWQIVSRGVSQVLCSGGDWKAGGA